MSVHELETLEAGTLVLLGGNRAVRVPPNVASAFQPGDTLLAVEATGELLLVPAAERRTAEHAVTQAVDAFEQLRFVSDEQVSGFFEAFARNLADPSIWAKIQEVNARDVQAAKARGRSTTRLEANERLRQGMIDGLRAWSRADSGRGRVLETVTHETWQAELVAAPLGVVGFVFEGRPNVVADATGVLRGGNSVVFRIGRDALGTAQAILEHALTPALLAHGLPTGAVSLVGSAAHAAGWALFSDARLSLAVARGSGPAVDTLGALARKAGVPVSLHGTGGAWVVASTKADSARFERAVANSLDRKVCNTLNTCCIPESAAAALVPAFLRGLQLAAERRKQPFKLHVARSSERFVPRELFDKQVLVARAEGPSPEPQAQLIDDDQLGREWEWEDSPEVTLRVVTDTAEAIALFNQQSPHFVASLITEDAEERERFFQAVDAPFVGDDFTRWVDGQFALRKPELGLSNWERGRLLGRGGILAGDGVFTVRTRARQLPRS